MVQKKHPEVKKNKVTEHVPTHKKPEKETEIGDYIAGILDNNGKIRKNGIKIILNSKEASLVYYIKKKIGYGRVIKVKSKKALVLIITKQEGIEKTIKLINGKITRDVKIIQ